MKNTEIGTLYVKPLAQHTMHTYGVCPTLLNLAFLFSLCPPTLVSVWKVQQGIYSLSIKNGSSLYKVWVLQKVYLEMTPLFSL